MNHQRLFVFASLAVPLLGCGTAAHQAMNSNDWGKACQALQGQRPPNHQPTPDERRFIDGLASRTGATLSIHPLAAEVLTQRLQMAGLTSSALHATEFVISLAKLPDEARGLSVGAPWIRTSLRARGGDYPFPLVTKDAQREWLAGQVSRPVAPSSAPRPPAFVARKEPTPEDHPILDALGGIAASMTGQITGGLYRPTADPFVPETKKQRAEREAWNAQHLAEYNQAVAKAEAEDRRNQEAHAQQLATRDRAIDAFAAASVPRCEGGGKVIDQDIHLAPGATCRWLDLSTEPLQAPDANPYVSIQVAFQVASANAVCAAQLETQYPLVAGEDEFGTVLTKAFQQPQPLLNNTSQVVTYY